MFQVDNPTAAPTRPASTTAGTPGWYTGGNPATQTPATILEAEMMNMIMAEMLGILAAAGIAPNKAASNQLALSIAALASTAVASGSAVAPAAVAMTNADVVASAAQASAKVITVSGVLTGNHNLILPSLGKWLIINNTTGAFTLTAKTAAGSGYIIRQGFGYDVYGDGTNIQPAGAQLFWGTAAAPTLQTLETYLLTST